MKRFIFIFSIFACSVCTQAAESDAEILAHVEPHLKSTFEPERSAALSILTAIHTEAAARRALAYFKAQKYPDTSDVSACTILLAVLPPEELLELTQSKNDALARAGSEALALGDPEKVVAMIKILAEKPDDKSHLTAGEVLLRFDAHVRMSHPDKQKLAAELTWVYARCPNASIRQHGLALSATLRSLTEELARVFMRDKDDHVRGDLPFVLLNNLSTPLYDWSIPLLFEMARDKDDVLRLSAVQTLERNSSRWSDKDRQAAMELMKAGLSDVNPNARRHAIDYFVQNFSEDALKEIERLTTDQDNEVALVALKAVQKMRSPRVADLAFAATQITVHKGPKTPDGKADWMAMRKERNEQEIRIAGLKILAELNDRRTVSVATQMASDPNWDIASAGRRTLSASGMVDAATVKAASVGAGRGVALNDTLRRTLTLDPTQRVDELERLYKGMDASQRLTLLKQFEGKDTDNSNVLALQFLVNRLKDSQPAVRQAALRDLAVGTNPFNRAPTITEGAVEAIELLNDRDPGVVQAAGHLLKELPYRSLKPLAARALLANSEDETGELKAFISSAISRDNELLIRCLKHKDRTVRAEAQRQIRPWQWDKPDICMAILAGAEHVRELPPGTPSSAQFIPQILQAALKDPPHCAPYFALIGRIDDVQAGDVLKVSARSLDRPVRWAALDALVARGDESDATLDHALARLLSSELNSHTFATWPVLSARLLERLDTFKTLCTPDRIERLRAEIERKIKDSGALGEPQ